jgi:hypothetical protein
MGLDRSIGFVFCSRDVHYSINARPGMIPRKDKLKRPALIFSLRSGKRQQARSRGPSGRRQADLLFGEKKWPIKQSHLQYGPDLGKNGHELSKFSEIRFSRSG